MSPSHRFKSRFLKSSSTQHSSKNQHASFQQSPILILCDFCERDGPAVVFTTTVKLFPSENESGNQDKVPRENHQQQQEHEISSDSYREKQDDEPSEQDSTTKPESPKKHADNADSPTTDQNSNVTLQEVDGSATTLDTQQEGTEDGDHTEANVDTESSLLSKLRRNGSSDSSSSIQSSQQKSTNSHLPQSANHAKQDIPIEEDVPKRKRRKRKHFAKRFLENDNSSTSSFDTGTNGSTQDTIPSSTTSNGKTQNHPTFFQRKSVNTNSQTTKKPHHLVGSTKSQTFRSQTEDFLFQSQLSIPFKRAESIARLNQICLRSLSGEHVGPGKEGACLFGNRVQGFTFSYVFKIKDSKARGHARWMSFCLISTNLVDLAMNWSFLTRAIKNWVRDMKNASNVVFAEEQREMEREAEQFRLMGRDPLSMHQQGGTSISSNGSILSNSHHNAGNSRGSSFATHTNRMSSRHEMLRRIGFRSTKRSREKLRCLPDLLRTGNFFELLHINVCVVLKAFLNRLVFLEKEPSPESCSQYNTSNGSKAKQFTFFDLYNQLKGIEDDYRKVAECIIYHVLVGNQLVLRGDNTNCLSDIIECMIELVPQASIEYPREEHDKYCPIYQANFLVLHSSVSLKHGNTNVIDPESTLLIDMEAEYNEKHVPQIHSLTLTSALRSSQMDNIPRTQLGSEIFKLLSSCKGKSSYHSRLGLLKHRYLSRSKLLTQIYKSVHNVNAIKENETAFLNMYGCGQDDIRVLRNFATGQSRRSKPQTTS